MQTAERARLPGMIAREALDEVARDAKQAMETVEQKLPHGFPEALHISTQNGFLSRLKKIG